ncbi:T4 beta protein [Streptomyces sp. 846.5]|nr:beta family protein [Streptomyces sp. 846.5]TDU03299.1 T4 beta protein [Streptomyces sp. 846.5]
MEYVPLLRGREGELKALGEISPEVRTRIRPVLEVVLDGTPRRTVQKFFRQAGNHLPADLTITLDCGSLIQYGPIGTGYTGAANGWLSEAFDQFKFSIIPVVRTTDPPAALAEARDAQLLHRQGICLRIDIQDPSASSARRRRLVDSVLETLDLGPVHIDLLLDVGYLPDARAVTWAARSALGLLDWSRASPWRSTALAAGSFPRSVADRPKARRLRLHRWETDLWHHVAQHCGGDPPAFADYGVTHPVHPTNPRPGKPNLRYTNGRDWDVLVANSYDNDEFYDLCELLLGSPAWPPTAMPLSWGDREFALRAGTRPGPGAGREWRAWATSHHLAHVSDRIHTYGTP